MEYPFFSIIIVNFNAGIMLSKVMTAIAEQTYRNFEVIVVDNNSQDDSWRATEQLPFPCRLIRLDNNTGFASANNLAIKNHAQGDWVFLLNPDAYPEPACLETVAKNIALMPTINCFACTLIDANRPTHLDGIGDTYHVSGLHWRNGHGAHRSIAPTHPVQVFSACAAAAVYRTQTYRQLDGFDETYFAYSEDVDLGFRLRLAGGVTVLLPDALVHHVGSGITGRSSDFSIYHGHRNLTWTFLKNVPTPLMFLLLPIHLAMTVCMGLFFASSGHLGLYIKAKRDALRQIGFQLAQRKKIQSERVCSCLELLQAMSWLPRSLSIRIISIRENFSNHVTRQMKLISEQQKLTHVIHSIWSYCFPGKKQRQSPVSVIIVNYNAGLLLVSCVQSALEQAQQVIVVDNASSDSSLSELKIRFPAENRLQIIRLDSNRGFAAGCNRGLKEATAPYMLFLNPDCILGTGSLQNLVQVISTDPRIGMTGGYLINEDGTEQGGGRRFIPTPWRAFVRAFGLYRLEKYWPQLFPDFHLHQQPLPQAPVEVEAISGALMLVRREAIVDVGTWDEDYFLHCEDLDWCMRFQQKGWKILFVPDAPVIHYQGTCSRSHPFFVAWHKHKGMLRFYQKFFRHQYSGIIMALVALGVWLRFGITVLFYSFQYIHNLLSFKHE